MKLNLGCGMNKMSGHINVDKFPQCQPDLVMDMEVTPWTFKDSEVEGIVLNHVLEHIGKDVDVFFGVMKEMYRVCKNGAIIEINVPHPRHDNFINDPTHVRIITPDLMTLFSKKKCQMWKETNASNSQLALYLDVDFEMVSANIIIEERYMAKLQSGAMTQDAYSEIYKTCNNVASEFRIKLKVVK